MTEAAFRALAESLQSQQFFLRQEAERLRAVSGLLGREPDLHSWRGAARNAFDNELALLRAAVESTLAAVDAALSSTSRASESVLSRVE